MHVEAEKESPFNLAPGQQPYLVQSERAYVCSGSCGEEGHH